MFRNTRWWWNRGLLGELLGDEKVLREILCLGPSMVKPVRKRGGNAAASRGMMVVCRQPCASGRLGPDSNWAPKEYGRWGPPGGGRNR